MFPRTMVCPQGSRHSDLSDPASCLSPCLTTRDLSLSLPICKMGIITANLAE